MMEHEVAWPPVSARAAFLSSPSGRRKFRQDQTEITYTSPLRKPATAPSLLENLRAIRAERDVPTLNVEEEEDEETLKLQLAAIEAKLKLRKLQQNKARFETVVSGDGAVPARPTSPFKRPTSSSGTPSSQRFSHDVVQVRGSPIRKPVGPLEPRSPSRVLLGIDKGVTGADISLRRARTVTAAAKTRGDGDHRPISRLHTHGPRSIKTTHQSGTAPTPKSFSERMNAARVTDNDTAQKHEAASLTRKRAFAIDKNEIKGFRQTAEISRNETLSRSPVRKTSHAEYSRDQIMGRSSEMSSHRGLKKSRTMPELNQDPSMQQFRSDNEIDDNEMNEQGSAGDAALFEGYSQQHLSTRILPHSFLKRTLPSEQHTTFRIPELLREIKSPEYRMPDSVGDYVVFAIVASKSAPFDQKKNRDEQNMMKSNEWEDQWQDGLNNQRKYIVFTLTDLQWTIKLYLFGTAVPRYHRLAPGTVVAILNPGIMPPKRGRQDTGDFSLTLNDGDDTVLEIGTAQHLGFCNAVKKDGKDCGDWIDSSKTEICEWHLNAEIAKTQSKRMGINAGTNGLGRYGSSTTETGFGSRGKKGANGEVRGKGLLPDQRKQKYDYDSASFYFISKGTVGVSNSGSLAQQDNYIGPGRGEFVFANDGQLERDREARLAKKTATQEKERQIARQLSSFSSGGAGGEYLRHQIGNSLTKSKSHRTIPNTEPDMQISGQQPTLTKSSSVRAHILDTDSTGPHRQAAADRAQNDTVTDSGVVFKRKRTADSVRLSPVKIKKTRFLTDQGIKIAGRESLGPNGSNNGFVSDDKKRKGCGKPTTDGVDGIDNDDDNDDADDDDLEIV